MTSRPRPLIIQSPLRPRIYLVMPRPYCPAHFRVRVRVRVRARVRVRVKG